MPPDAARAEARAWAARALRVEVAGVDAAGGVDVAARAELDCPPALAYALLTHPDGASIFRAIDRCVRREALLPPGGGGGAATGAEARGGAAGGGAAGAEARDDAAGGWEHLLVVNESVWSIGGGLVRGRCATEMLVRQRFAAAGEEGEVHVRLAPGGAAPRGLVGLDVSWRVTAAGAAGCRVELAQRLTLAAAPPALLRGLFLGYARREAERTFEDLAAAVARGGGEAAAGPPAGRCACGGDPRSVLRRGSDGSESGASSGGASSASSGAAAAASAAADPRSHALGALRTAEPLTPAPLAPAPAAWLLRLALLCLLLLLCLLCLLLLATGGGGGGAVPRILN
jgi:hypothetical protein